MSTVKIQRAGTPPRRYLYRVDKDLLKTRILGRLKALGLSEPEVTRRAGLHKHTIQNIKKGHIPSANRLAALAGALGVPSTYLTGEADTSDVSLVPQFGANDSNHASL